MELSQKVKDDLQWWLQNLSTVYANIYIEQTDITIYTHSNEGWGCHAPTLGKDMEADGTMLKSNIISMF